MLGGGYLGQLYLGQSTGDSTTSIAITKSLKYTVKSAVPITKSLQYTIKTTPVGTDLLGGNGNFESATGTTNANFTAPGFLLTAAGSTSVVTIDTTQAALGSRSVKLAVDASNTNNGIKLSGNLTVLPNTNYRLVISTKSDTAGQLQLQLGNGTGNFLQSDNITWNTTANYTNINTTTGFVRSTIFFQTAPGQTTLQITDLKRSGLSTQASRTFWIDDIEIAQNPLIIKSLRYAVKAAIPITKSLKYTVKAAAAITKSLKYTIKLTPTAITKSLKYTVKKSIPITKSLKYTVKKSIAITKSLKYTVKKTPSAITKSLKYTIKKSLPITKALTYIVKNRVVITKTLSYRLTPIVKTLPLKYAVKVRGRGVSLSMAYGLKVNQWVDQDNSADAGYTATAPITEEWSVSKPGVSKFSSPATPSTAEWSDKQEGRNLWHIKP